MLVLVAMYMKGCIKYFKTFISHFIANFSPLWLYHNNFIFFKKTTTTTTIALNIIYLHISFISKFNQNFLVNNGHFGSNVFFSYNLSHSLTAEKSRKFFVFPFVNMNNIAVF